MFIFSAHPPLPHYIAQSSEGPNIYKICQAKYSLRSTNQLYIAGKARKGKNGRSFFLNLTKIQNILGYVTQPALQGP